MSTRSSSAYSETEPRLTAHQRLREATRASHERVDAAFANYDLSDREQYARFLLKHAAAFVPAEDALTEAGADKLFDGWDEQRRAALLLADLADLDLAMPEKIVPPPYACAASVAGGAYVLEGSRLGGELLRKQVGDQFPRRYLDAIHPSGRWREFVAGLDRILYEEAFVERAIASAIRTFGMFEPVRA